MLRLLASMTTILIILVGCKTVDEYAGTGPLVVTPKIKAFLDKHSWKMESAVAVAYNGRYAYSYSCPQSLGCQGDAFNPDFVIQTCEEKAPRCALYSHSGFIKWQGPVTVGSPQDNSVLSEQASATFEVAKKWLGTKCIDNFERHLKRTPKYKITVFAYSRVGTSGPYACNGYSGTSFDKTKEDAISGCEKFRSKYQALSDAPCDVFAIGNDLVWKGLADETAAASSSRPIALQWDGYSNLIAGTVNLNQGKDGGSVALTLPNNDGNCAGKYSMFDRTNGVWSLKCTNGMAASGTLTAYGTGKGSSGKGRDKNGNSVSYTLGGS